MDRSDQTDTQRAAGAATIGAGAPALIVGVSRVRRTGAAFFLGDTAFLSDARFRKLLRRLPDPDDFNSAVGAWFIALAAARRNGRPELDVETETGSRFLDDLRAVGLLTEAGFRPEPFEAWKPMTPQQVAAGKARAASGSRGEDGKFLLAGTSALDTLDQRVQPSTLVKSAQLTSTQTTEGVQGGPLGMTEAEAHLLSDIGHHGAFIRPDSPLGIRLFQLIDRRGIEAVRAEFDAMVAVADRLSDRQWVLGLENRLEKIPTNHDAVAEDVAERDAVAERRKWEQVQKRRLERFRFTGQWPAEFGPEPEWDQSWGVRPLAKVVSS